MTHIRSGVFVMALPVRPNIGNRGFTLVELMIAMAVGGIVMTAVMTAFISQHRSYLAQDDVVEMQQNARIAMDMLSREIRSAGLDPTGNANGEIVTATVGRLGFTRDLNNDGDTDDTDEAITYGFSNSNDANADGIADTGSAPLGRNTGTATGIDGSGFQPLADNFRAIEFYYSMADGSQTLAPAALNNIRSIQISILVQTSRADVNGPAAQNYTTPSDNTWTSTAGFRSRYLTTTIQCRNLGL